MQNIAGDHKNIANDWRKCKMCASAAIMSKISTNIARVFRITGNVHKLLTIVQLTCHNAAGYQNEQSMSKIKRKMLENIANVCRGLRILKE